ncbi:MAG: hypothetical protein Q8L48_01770 [Archangium sp.]|nr:hypothetical protein [Archangium sp.]
MLLVLLALAFGSGAPPARPESLPRLELLDPRGARYTDETFRQRGVVVVVTAPIATQGGVQQAWHDALTPHASDGKGPAIVILEDMSQSWARSIVIARIKAVYRPGGIVLLLDEDGAVRKSFGVGENTTTAFAFAPTGKLVAVETGAASPALALKLVAAARPQ